MVDGNNRFRGAEQQGEFAEWEHESPYVVLGVPEESDQATIRDAFRKLGKELHPDVAQGDKVLEERFKRVGAAYNVLSKPDKRARYDHYAGHPHDSSPGQTARHSTNTNTDQRVISQVGVGLRNSFKRGYRLTDIDKVVLRERGLQLVRTTTLATYAEFTHSYKRIGLDHSSVDNDLEILKTVANAVEGLAKNGDFDLLRDYVRGAVRNKKLSKQFRAMLSAVLNSDEVITPMRTRIEAMRAEGKSASECRDELLKFREIGVDTYPTMVSLGLNRIPPSLRRVLRPFRIVR